MFFSVSKTVDNNFPNNYTFGDIICNTDNGWQLEDRHDTTLLYKGICFDQPMQHAITEPSGSCEGNFCVFEYNKSTKELTIKTDKHRACRIYTNKEKISNLYKLPHAIWSDNTLKIDQSLAVSYSYHDAIGLIEDSYTNYDEVVDWAYNRLYNKIKYFVEQNTLPLKIFLSGGVDSMLVYSFIKQFTDNYEFVFEQVVQYDHFYMANQDTIEKTVELGTQTHHWRDPCVIISGAPGDEFLLRNPKMCQIWCNWHGINLQNVIDKYPDAYMYKFFKKHLTPLHQKDSLEYLDHAELVRHLCNINVNDPQHWHIGNTLMFTPLRDIKIFEKLARLPFSSGLDQILYAKFSKDLIAKNDSELLKYVSPYKNFEPRKALIPFYNKHFK